jgi:hypothetical protein
MRIRWELEVGNTTTNQKAVELIAALERTGREVKSVTIKGSEIKVDLITSEDETYNPLDYADFKRK